MIRYWTWFFCNIKFTFRCSPNEVDFWTDILIRKILLNSKIREIKCFLCVIVKITKYYLNTWDFFESNTLLIDIFNRSLQKVSFISPIISLTLNWTWINVKTCNFSAIKAKILVEIIPLINLVSAKLHLIACKLFYQKCLNFSGCCNGIPFNEENVFDHFTSLWKICFQMIQNFYFA